MAALVSDAEKYSAELLIAVMKRFSALDAELRYSINPRIALECALVESCRMQSDNFTAFAERISRLEKKLDGAVVTGVRASESTDSAAVSYGEKPRDAFACWGKIVTYLRKNENMVVFSAAGEQEDVEMDGNTLTVYADGDWFMTLSTPEALEALQRAARSVHPELKVVVDKRVGSIDMDSEIAKIKAIAGNAKINIKKR